MKRVLLLGVALAAALSVPAANAAEVVCPGVYVESGAASSYGYQEDCVVVDDTVEGYGYDYVYTPQGTIYTYRWVVVGDDVCAGYYMNSDMPVVMALNDDENRCVL